MKRKAKISRKTKETNINVDLNIDGKGKYKIETGIGFLNHMLEQLSKHSSMDINLKAKGDTHIDLHHTTEDTGIAIGEALKKASKKFLIHKTSLEPVVYTKVEASGVELTIRYLCKPRDRREIEEDIWESILTEFKKEMDVDFAYPTVRRYMEKEEGKEIVMKEKYQNKSN